MLGGGANQRARPRDIGPRSRWLVVAVLALVTVAAIAALWAAIALMASGRVYVHGEGRWSKAQQAAVFHLDRYAETGDRAELMQARAALEIPLGDRRARLALQGPAYDYAAARAGFLRGGNHPGDVPLMILPFEYFEHAPYIRRAIAIWVRADRRILELRTVADRLEALWREPPPPPDAIARQRERLTELDAQLRDLETRFSALLGDGLRTLRVLLAAGGALLLLALGSAAAEIFLWATHRVAASERRF